MKKFLFTLAALLMAGGLFAQENYLYVPDIELTQEEATNGVQGKAVFVVAHFEQYVSAVDWILDLPDGVTFVSGSMPNAAKPYVYQYVDVEDDDTGEIVPTLVSQRMAPQLFGNYPHWIFVTALGAETDNCYSEDGSICYGAPKWGVDPVEFNYYRMVLNIDAGFTGGDITVHGDLSGTPDPRGESAPQSSFEKVCKITIEQPAGEPAPAPEFVWSEESFTMEAVCEGHTVILMIDGVEVSNPYTVPQTYEDQHIVFTAYTVKNDGESENSATVESDEVLVPAKSLTPSNKPTITVTPGNDFYMIEATGTGEVHLYVGGVEVENPYKVNRPAYGQEDITVSVRATNLDSDPDGEIQYAVAEDTKDVPVPAKEEKVYTTKTPYVDVDDSEDGVITLTAGCEDECSSLVLVVVYINMEDGSENEVRYEGGTVTIDLQYGEAQYINYWAEATAVLPEDYDSVEPASSAPVTFYEIPAKPWETLQGTLQIGEVNQENGQFTVTYTGTENVIIECEGMVPANRDASNTFQLPGYGTYRVTVKAIANDYEYNGNFITAQNDLAWNAPVNPDAPAAPEITSMPVKVGEVYYVFVYASTDEEGVQVTLYSCDEDGSNPVEVPATGHALDRRDEGYYAYFYAVAYDEETGLYTTTDVTPIYVMDLDDPTAINEMNAGKTVAAVRYFNMAGQEMQEANGMTIVVTTYTDGTSSAVKVMK